MHSSLQRLNSIFALATSALLCMLAVIDTTSFPQRKPTGTVKVTGLETVYGRAIWHMDRRAQDYLVTSFDISANFTELFTWNTKQLFVSLVAEYASPDHALNQVVIWDRILRTPQDASVQLQAEENKYGLREVSKSFGGIDNTTFTLKWNVMPKVGRLHYGDEVASAAVRIPSHVVELDEHGQTVKRKAQKMYY